MMGKGKLLIASKSSVFSEMDALSNLCNYENFITKEVPIKNQINVSVQKCSARPATFAAFATDWNAGVLC